MAAQRLGQADAAGAAAQQAGAGLRGRQSVAHGAEIARLAALQGEPRDGAGDVGRGPQQRRAHPRAASRSPRRKPTASSRSGDRLGIAQRARQPRGKLARAGAGDRAVDGGEQAALPLARRASAAARGWRGSAHR